MLDSHNDSLITKKGDNPWARGSSLKAKIRRKLADCHCRQYHTWIITMMFDIVMPASTMLETMANLESSNHLWKKKGKFPFILRLLFEREGSLTYILRLQRLFFHGSLSPAQHVQLEHGQTVDILALAPRSSHVAYNFRARLRTTSIGSPGYRRSFLSCGAKTTFEGKTCQGWCLISQ